MGAGAGPPGAPAPAGGEQLASSRGRHAPDAAEGAARGGEPRILVIEDEVGIVDFVERGLRTHGFRVEAALDGIDGERRALAGTFEAVVLDLMLPRKGGLDVLRSIHAGRPATPVVILTARGETTQRVAGLDAGAIDYIVKPFAVAELAARLRAHIRRARLESPTILRAGDVEVDLLAHEVICQGGRVWLAPREFDLLAYFLRHRTRVASREEILAAVWARHGAPDLRLVDVYVRYVRAKLARAGSRLQIVTVRNVGYRLGA